MLASACINADVELIVRVIEPAPPAASTSTVVVPGPATLNTTPGGPPAAGAADRRTWTARLFDHFESLRVRVNNGDRSSDIIGASIDIEGPYGSVMQVRCRARCSL